METTYLHQLNAKSILTVLKLNKEFTVDILCKFVKNVKEFCPEFKVYCLTDCMNHDKLKSIGVEPIPLKYGWNGWFSKMELFRPDIIGNFLYIDLDTVLIDSIDEFFELKRTTMLSDFYFPERSASGLMYIKQADKYKVWNNFINDPDRHMSDAGTLGDQKIIGDILYDCDRFQKILPNKVLSYKAHIRYPHQSRFEKGNGSIPTGAKIICFHGNPRPWNVRLPL